MKFLKSEIVTGVLLCFATFAALLTVNFGYHEIYQNFFLLNLSFNLTLRDFINDALMALFFLLIGLELKKEILIGELSTKKKFALPAIAAFGGIIFPALIFIYFNFSEEKNLRGFAIPTATDIAFAYGIISLFGKRISNSLKVFLVALAIIDDLVAILIIAFFYSQNIDFFYLALAALLLCFLAFLNYKNSNKISLYLFSGVFLWLMILKSGLHPTLSGVLLAMFIPLQIKNESPLSKLAHKISPFVNFLILPLFAFANAGVYVKNFSTEIFSQPLVLGIICGLFFGKQIGVMLFSFLAVKLKIAHLPRGANWLEFYAAAILTGIGFTMSLFIGSLAFLGNDLLLDEVKIAVLIGSVFSVIFGVLIISYNIKRR